MIWRYRASVIRRLWREGCLAAAALEAARQSPARPTDTAAADRQLDTRTLQPPLVWGKPEQFAKRQLTVRLKRLSALWGRHGRGATSPQVEAESCYGWVMRPPRALACGQSTSSRSLTISSALARFTRTRYSTSEEVLGADRPMAVNRRRDIIRRVRPKVVPAVRYCTDQRGSILCMSSCCELPPRPAPQPRNRGSAGVARLEPEVAIYSAMAWT